MQYLIWFDDNKKKPTGQKVQEAVARYTERFQAIPTTILVHESDVVEIEGITIAPKSTIQKNNFWVGREE